MGEFLSAFPGQHRKTLPGGREFGRQGARFAIAY